MLAAVAQICSTPSISRNISICRDIIRRSAASGAKLVYLPEASDFIAPTSQVLSLSSRLEESPFVHAIREEAQSNDIWVGVGIHEVSTTDDQPVFNTQLLVDPQGGIKGRYEKLHLFDVKDIKEGTKILESNTTKPGRRLVPPVDTPIGKVGMLTCYDLRFPEPSLLLRRQGTQILTYPSAFTMRTGEAHWELLLRARAVETQCYVLAPAQVGEHFPGSNPTPDSAKPTLPRISYGKAMIIDPWGTVLAKCVDDPAGQQEKGTICIADIDLGWLERVRRDMPLWEQRREDVYELKQMN